VVVSVIKEEQNLTQIKEHLAAVRAFGLMHLTVVINKIDEEANIPVPKGLTTYLDPIKNETMKG